MRTWFPVILLVLFVTACAERAPVAGPPEDTEAPQYSAGGNAQLQRYIVVLRPGVADPDRVTDQLVRGAGGQEHFRYRHALVGFAASIPAPAVEGIRRNPNVVLVEPDGIVTTVETQTNATWGLDRIDQRNRPLNGTYTYETSGAGVHVYIIDTGIRASHGEFSGRIGNGYTAISDGRGTNDCNGHGTHVAGTVGGTVYGVAKQVTLHPVRVLNCQGSGTISGVIAGVDWVTANAVKPAVANMSLGGGASSALDNAVTSSVNSGVTYAVAAGNNNRNACNYSPARAAAALTVGATTSTDARASYSNYGSCVDLFAPGSSITSAWHTSNSATSTISGTSMASPHVAGVAALYLSLPGNGSASPGTVGNAIIANATTGVVGNPGSGSPNRLLYSLFGGGGGGGGGGDDDPPPNQAPTASFTASCNDLTCSFNGSGSSDPDGSIVSYSWNFGDGTSGSGVSAGKTYSSGGTYTVTLTVTDDDGATGSQSQNVTVSAPDPGPGTAVHVANLTASVQTAGPNWRPTVTVTVRNAANQLVSGATVQATWSTGGGESCTTGSNGTCSITSGMLNRNVSSTTFTVQNVTGSNMTWDSGAGVSSLTISKP